MIEKIMVIITSLPFEVHFKTPEGGKVLLTMFFGVVLYMILTIIVDYVDSQHIKHCKKCQKNLKK